MTDMTPLPNPARTAPRRATTRTRWAVLLVALVGVAGCRGRGEYSPSNELADPQPASASASAGAGGDTPGAATDAASAGQPVAGADVPPASQPDATDPAALYAQCRERVEGPEAAGECTVDSDCVAGGCSGEICATAAAMDGVLGSCEVLPCFSVLDHCGCVEGRCSWSVKADARARPLIQLPDQLPDAAGG